MFIRMLKTTSGSRDGRFVEKFDEGEIYDLTDSDSLADVFINTLEVAKEVEADISAETIDAEDSTEEVEKSLDDMTGNELKDVAEANDIDVTGIKKVGDLRKAVIAGLESSDGEL